MQRGFASILIILLIVTLVTITIAGYYISHAEWNDINPPLYQPTSTYIKLHQNSESTSSAIPSPCPLVVVGDHAEHKCN